MPWKALFPRQAWKPLWPPYFDHIWNAGSVGNRTEITCSGQISYRLVGFRGVLPRAVFLDQCGIGGIFSSSMNSLVLFSGVLESPWREGRMYWQCISLCLCLPRDLHLLYSSLHVLTPFFTLAFGKLSGLSCAILSSLFSQAACVVLTLLSYKDFLIFHFGFFFFFFSLSALQPPSPHHSSLHPPTPAFFFLFLFCLNFQISLRGETTSIGKNQAKPSHLVMVSGTLFRWWHIFRNQCPAGLCS